MFFEGLGTFLVVIIILVIVLAIVSSCVRIVPRPVRWWWSGWAVIWEPTA